MALADTVPIDPNSTGGNRSLSALEQTNQSQTRQAIITSARTQMMGLLPTLTDDIRSPAQWVVTSLQTSHSLLNFDISALGGDDKADDHETLTSPMLNPSGSPADAQVTPWSASTGYHHAHGILPTHDALLMNMHSVNSIWGPATKFDVHPYYGQNYFSQHGYYGGEMSLDIAKPTVTQDATWGAVGISYTNGATDLMDVNRGINFNGSLNFNEHLALNSGIAESDSSGSSRYVLLQWKLPLH